MDLIRWGVGGWRCGTLLGPSTGANPNVQACALASTLRQRKRRFVQISLK